MFNYVIREKLICKIWRKLNSDGLAGGSDGKEFVGERDAVVCGGGGHGGCMVFI